MKKIIFTFTALLVASLHAHADQGQDLCSKKIEELALTASIALGRNPKMVSIAHPTEVKDNVVAVYVGTGPANYDYFEFTVENGPHACKVTNLNISPAFLLISK